MIRQHLRQELHRARAQTDELFGLLRPERMFDRPIDRRHRLIFYLGHVDAFDRNIMSTCGPRADVQPGWLDTLFARGIDPGSDNLPKDEPSDWPKREEVADYVARTRIQVDRMLDVVRPDLIHMAIEHRLMHAETLAYALHAMPFDAKQNPGVAVWPQAGAPDAEFIEVPAGIATLGRARSEEFGWDNEFEICRGHVPAFSISRFKVTNGEYLDFVNDGAPAPHFWSQHGGQWMYRGMFGLTPLYFDAPVYVTWKEANAYAQWKGRALPTEAQFHRAAFGTPDGNERPYAWGADEPSNEHGNFDFRAWDPAPVSAYAAGDSAWGVRQLIGNGWEWTSTVFGPLPGFVEHPSYPGYSKDFFDGEHYVLKGGSPRTAACLLRRTFRNWFRPDYPYVYATFRCIEN